MTYLIWGLGQGIAILIAACFGAQHSWIDGFALWAVITVLIDIRAKVTKES